jgi:lambda family phage portal protein
MSFIDRFTAAVSAFRAPRASASVSGGISRNYEGASVGRRTAGWNPGNDSINTALFTSADTLRARSRDIVRKNAWANNGPETFVSEAIGTGIKPQSAHPDAATKAKLQQLWLDWTDACDADGTQDFYGLQALATRGMVEGGEVFIRLRYRKDEDGLTVPLQLQLLEAEHCPVTLNQTLASGNVIRFGIEFNAIGQRVAYYLYPAHPGETSTFVPDAGTAKRIPAGEIIHLFRPVRPGQVRGEPWLSRALIRLYDYDQYTDAEVMRKKVAACFAAFITEEDPADPLPGNESAIIDDGLDTAEYAPDGVDFAGLEPGTMQKLKPGEDVKFSEPADVGGGFESFNRAALREIAVAVGCTYEQLTGDLTGVNYSSIRAGLLGFRRKVEQIQHSVIVYQFCRPLWAEFLKSAVFAGEISASDYSLNKRLYFRVKWVPPGWTWVDPAKELDAAKASVRSGFTSRARVVSESGYDIEDVDREIAQDQARADRLGLVLDTDARKTADNGMRPASRDAQNPDGLQQQPTEDPSEGSSLVQ